METSPENIKRLRFWAELPFEIGKHACQAIAHDINVLLNINEPPTDEYITNVPITHPLYGAKRVKR